MKLDVIFAHLLSRARATGTDQHIDLKGGARLAVRVQAGQVALTIARTPQKVGDVELVTFRKVCQVPASARRVPADGQAVRQVEAQTWHVVGFVWTEEEQSHGA